ncbi:diguanylate cyclase domain-containing protein [Oceanobacillus sp. 1P07AA]|uniref:diguanylate cyclase domain-containing protein n=1 Tax=Oceanobacillus sp. 1P07AA TaxID=3132293 RepID=UPI0039A5DDF2
MIILHVSNQLRSNFIEKLYRNMSDFIENKNLNWIPSLFDTVGSYLNCSNITVYEWDEGESCYFLIYHSNDEKVPHIFMSNHLEAIDDKTNTIIKIDTPSHPWKIIINHTTNDNMDQLKIDVVKIEINNYLTTFSSILHNMHMPLFNNRLLQLTNELSGSIHTSFIFQKIADVIQSTFHGITVSYMVTQEFTIPDHLNVKVMAWNDASLSSEIKQTFMKGHLQYDSDKLTLYLPITGKQGNYGVIEIHGEVIFTMNSNGKYFLTEVAKVCGNALETAFLFQHSRNEIDQLTKINQTSNHFNSRLDFREIINTLKSQFASYSSDSTFAILPLDGKYAGASVGNDPYFEQEEGLMFLHNLKNYTKDYKEIFFCGNFRDSEPNSIFQSVIAVPMKHENNLIGIVFIGHKEEYQYDYHQYKLMESMIQHSVVAIANTLQKEQLTKALAVDHLTGLYSRQYLEETVNTHMKEGSKGALILFDIDDFKQVNDSYGHLIGDQVLIQVSQALQQVVKDKYIAARWGGEELAIYAQQISLEEAIEISRKACDIVEKTTNPRVTLSSGVSSWSNDDNNSANSIWERSDKALYEAKELGKNKVIYK